MENGCKSNLVVLDTELGYVDGQDQDLTCALDILKKKEGLELLAQFSTSYYWHGLLPHHRTTD